MKPYARANTWVIEQLLCTGVMGIHICHARDPKAIETYMHMGARYPFRDYPNTPQVPMQGLRGNSASYAADIWGVSGGTYQHIADLWPLNPRGEIIFGVKIEDTYADKTVAQTLAIPGMAMAEWGPGDHNLWLNGYNGVEDGGLSGHPVIRDAAGKVVSDVSALPNMEAVRAKVLAECKKNKVMFLNAAETEPGHNNAFSRSRTVAWSWRPARAARTSRSWAANSPSGKCLSERSTSTTLPRGAVRSTGSEDRHCAPSALRPGRSFRPCAFGAVGEVGCGPAAAQRLDQRDRRGSGDRAGPGSARGAHSGRLPGT